MVYKLISKSFTLIELLIVIVIIGIITTAIIPEIKGMQNRAKYIRVEKDFQDLRAAIFMAQSSTGKPLKDITNSGCTMCVCKNSAYSTGYVGGEPDYRDKNMKILTEDDVCRINWKNALYRIELAAGLAVGSLASLQKDPWGSPYLLDENDEERGCLGKDRIISPGVDGYYSGDGKTTYFIAPSFCPGAY